MTSLARQDIGYIGRFDFSSAEGPVFSWPGTTIAVRFRGKGISAHMRPVKPSQADNWLNVIIDDREAVPLHINKEGIYILASSLGEGEHEIRLFKRTEALVGELQFMGFILPEGGRLLGAPEFSERRMEYIGDSITCGYGNEAPGIDSGFKPEEENHYLSYAAIAARELGAEHTTLAWSGQGVYQNYDRSKGSTMSDKYLLTLPDREECIWNFKSWTPQVVVINLGTNDFAQGAPDTGLFSEAYGKLVRTVRSNYPGAHIFCAVGPMTHEPVSCISSIVQDFNVNGDMLVHYIEFPMQNTAVNGIGGDWHPSLKTHADMARQLVKDVRSKLNW